MRGRGENNASKQKRVRRLRKKWKNNMVKKRVTKSSTPVKTKAPSKGSQARSAKSKGRLGQQEIRDALLDIFPDLEPEDIRSTSMGVSGADLQLSPKAKGLLPIDAEVKRRKSALTTLYSWLTQRKKKDDLDQVLFFRNDRQPWLVVIDLSYYLKLLKGNSK